MKTWMRAVAGGSGRGHVKVLCSQYFQGFNSYIPCDYVATHNPGKLSLALLLTSYILMLRFSTQHSLVHKHNQSGALLGK
jgi:hypothetical protein